MTYRTTRDTGKSLNTIYLDDKKVRKWETQALEVWLQHIRRLRQCSTTQQLKQRFDDDIEDHDKVYMERQKRLKRCLMPQFTAWRMKHHYETLDIYLHSLKDFEKDMTILQE